MHHNFSFYILAAAALILGAALIYNFFFSPYAVTRRKLFNENGKNIFSFQNGEIAKIVGTIKYVAPPLIAPLSGKNCAYYHVVVQQYKSGHKGGGFWRTIIEEEGVGNLVIKDGSSYAMIETGKVKSYLKSHRIYTSGFLKDPTVKLENYLSEHGFESAGLGMNYSIRYMEGILEEGEMLSVVGKGSWKRKSEITMEIPAEKILVIARPDDRIPVFFSDEPKALN